MKKILFLLFLSISNFVAKAQTNAEDTIIVFFKKMITDNQAKMTGWKVNPNIDKHRMISVQSVSDSTHIVLIWRKELDRKLNTDFLWFIWLDHGIVTFDSMLQVVSLFMTTPQGQFALHINNSHRAAKKLIKEYQQHTLDKRKVLYQYQMNQSDKELNYHLGKESLSKAERKKKVEKKQKE